MKPIKNEDENQLQMDNKIDNTNNINNKNEDNEDNEDKPILKKRNNNENTKQNNQSKVEDTNEYLLNKDDNNNEKLIKIKNNDMRSAKINEKLTNKRDPSLNLNLKSLNQDNPKDKRYSEFDKNTTYIQQEESLNPKEYKKLTFDVALDKMFRSNEFRNNLLSYEKTIDSLIENELMETMSNSYLYKILKYLFTNSFIKGYFIDYDTFRNYV